MNSPEPTPALERQSILQGALGFSVASVAVFGSWAFAGRWMHEHLGESGAYATWALLFIVIAAGTLKGLSFGVKSWPVFYAIFAAAFLLYAMGWTVAWFALRNWTGEWLGSLVGTVLMSLVFLAAFSAWPRAVPVASTLFVAHSIGYFVGGWLYKTVPGRPGMLLWGVAYGLGFGAGIGRALYLCQQVEKPSRSEG